jgi:hypothetical protein
MGRRPAGRPVRPFAVGGSPANRENPEAMRLRGLLLAALLASACGRGGIDRTAGASEAGSGPEPYEEIVDPGLREEYYWAIVGTGGCPGAAAGVTTGSAHPAAERCDAERLGTVAVCWDGDRFRPVEASGETRCAYWAADRASCADGAPTGRLWECVRTDAE